MKKLSMIVGTLLLAGSAFAAPNYLITHNNTHMTSNAAVNDGNMNGATKTPPGPTPGRVMWFAVAAACLGKSPCHAIIWMTDDAGTAKITKVGDVSMDLSTGIITPNSCNDCSSAYSVTINGPGETTISET